MNKLMMIALAACAAALVGCTATKIKYEKDDKGKVEYSIWHNGHWLKTETEQLTGGMSQDGKFEIGLQGYKSSPSEEFNRTMQTYTGAFVQLAQIAAAAYNPSASAAIQSATAKSDSTSAQQSAANLTQSRGEAESAVAKTAACADGSCSATTNAPTCTDGSCTTAK